MPDKKLTDNEIIKDFERIAQYQGFTSSASKTLKDTLDLINRLQAENEDLKTENLILSQKRFNIFERIEFTDKLKNRFKAEAYKECIEKVKEIIEGCHYISVYNELDNLLKELVGEDK